MLTIYAKKLFLSNKSYFLFRFKVQTQNVETVILKFFPRRLYVYEEVPPPQNNN
jgi:hypothetical protein